MNGRVSVVGIVGLLFLGLVLATCQMGGAKKGPPDGPAQEPVGDPEQGPPPQRDTVLQQICVLDEVAPELAGCPEVTDPPGIWTVAPLFDDGSGSWETWSALPEPLKRYCLYTGRDRFVGEEWQREHGLDCQPDEELIAPLQTALEKEMVSAFGPAFRHGIGRPGAVPTQATPTVRLAVLDGYGQATPPVDTESHGGSLYHIARDLLCEGLHGANPECAVEITTEVALPVEVAPGDPSAGHVGRPSDLAQAVYRAVGPWGSSHSYDQLVVNLSLGWDSVHGGMADGPSKIATVDVADNPRLSAVYDALHYAQCSGALVFAAAGNQTTLGESGPLLPAVWGAEGYRPQALLGTAGECQTRFGPGMDPAHDDRPLLHAVGAVDDDDRELAISRPGSEPQAVAFGAHGTVEARGLPTTPMSGTSLSTAVVSSAAALLWSLDPTAKPGDVYAGITDGQDLGRTTSAWFDLDPADSNPGPPVKLVKLCGTNMRVPCPATQYTAYKPDLTTLRANVPVVDVGSCETGLICTATVASEFSYAEESATCLVTQVEALRACDGSLPDPLPDLCNHVAGEGGESVLRKPVLFPMPPGRRCPYCLTVANAADPLLLMKTTDVLGAMYDTELVLKDIDGKVLHVVDLGMVQNPRNSVVPLPAFTDYPDVAKSILSGLHKEPGGMVSSYVSLVEVTHQ